MELEEKGSETLERIENYYNIKINRIRCDNAEENLTFEKECTRRKMRIKFEYTSFGMSQQNGQFEGKFATLYSQVRAMFIGSELMKDSENSFGLKQ